MIEPKAFYFQGASFKKNKKDITLKTNEEVKVAMEDFVDDIVYRCSERARCHTGRWKDCETKSRFIEIWCNKYSEILYNSLYYEKFMNSDIKWYYKVRNNLFDEIDDW